MSLTLKVWLGRVSLMYIVGRPILTFNTRRSQIHLPLTVSRSSLLLNAFSLVHLPPRVEYSEQASCLCPPQSSISLAHSRQTKFHAQFLAQSSTSLTKIDRSSLILNAQRVKYISHLQSTDQASCSMPIVVEHIFHPPMVKYFSHTQSTNWASRLTFGIVKYIPC